MKTEKLYWGINKKLLGRAIEVYDDNNKLVSRVLIDEKLLGKVSSKESIEDIFEELGIRRI